jgi:hypothetical protein
MISIIRNNNKKNFQTIFTYEFILHNRIYKKIIPLDFDLAFLYYHHTLFYRYKRKLATKNHTCHYLLVLALSSIIWKRRKKPYVCTMRIRPQKTIIRDDFFNHLRIIAFEMEDDRLFVRWFHSSSCDVLNNKINKTIKITMYIFLSLHLHWSREKNDFYLDILLRRKVCFLPFEQSRVLLFRRCLCGYWTWE